MISYYFKPAHNKELQVLDEYRPGAWVSVEHPTRVEIAQLTEQFQLNAGNMKDALDKDEMPRLDSDNGYNYIYTSYVFSTDEQEATTLPILFVIGEDLFITVAFKDMPHLDKFLEGNLSFATNKPTELFLLALEQIVSQYDEFINKISKHIQRIRSQLRSHSVAREDFVDFVVIEDDLNELLSVLQPLSAMLRRLSLGHYIDVQKTDKEIIEDLLLTSEQSIESCTSNIKTIGNIREAYSTISSNELNRTMKVLTIATVLIALPNVFFGMFGMNVRLPFADHPDGYFIIIGVTLVVMLITIWFAKIKKIF